MQIVLHGVAPFRIDPKAEERANPDKKGRWLIPLAFVAQVFLRVRSALIPESWTAPQVHLVIVLVIKCLRL